MLRKTIILTIALFLYLGYASCEEGDLREAIERLESRILTLEKKVQEQEKCINSHNKIVEEQKETISRYESRLSQFDEKLHRQTGSPVQLLEGIDLGLGGTMIIQGANNVNDATAGVQKDVSRTDASYSTDITVAKEFEEAGGRAFVHLEAGQGAGLEDNLTLYSNVNRDADNDNNVRITEFWYEQNLFKDRAVLSFGKLDPTAYFDNNEVANDETTQFLGRIFRNSPTVEFPDNSAGIRFAYLPFEWLELGYGVFDANSDWEKIGDNLFSIGQVSLKTNFFDLPGNYRFYCWNNNAYHTEWLDTEKTKEAAYGLGLSFDQKLTDIIILFSRYGWQNPKVYNPDITATGDLNYSLEHSWSSGFQIEGKPWGRENDVFAFAVGQIFPSDDYKKADTTRLAKTEGHLEAYYRIYINKYLSITSDFQYIWNPFGKDVSGGTKDIFIGGMRVQVDF